MVEATRQFESIFLRQYLSEALEPLIEGALEETSGSHVYRQMIVDSMADSLSINGTFGFANTLQAQLKAPKPPKEQEIDYENPL